MLKHALSDRVAIFSSRCVHCRFTAEHEHLQGEKRDNDLHMDCQSLSLGGNRRRLVSHRMAIHEAGAEYGIFLDVEAKNCPIKITAIKVNANKFPSLHVFVSHFEVCCCSAPRNCAPKCNSSNQCNRAIPWCR